MHASVEATWWLKNMCNCSSGHHMCIIQIHETKTHTRQIKIESERKREGGVGAGGLECFWTSFYGYRCQGF